MFGNKSEGTITFSYNSEEMFNDVSLLSAYMTKNIMGDKGSMMDEFNISDDEKGVYEVCVKQALPNIYESMLKLSFGVDDAFGVVNVEADEDEGLQRKAGKYIEFNIIDNADYNRNVLALVNETLETCIKYATLAEFYSVCTNADLFGLAQGKYTATLAQLKQRLFQLKKKAISPLLY